MSVRKHGNGSHLNPDSNMSISLNSLPPHHAQIIVEHFAKLSIAERAQLIYELLQARLQSMSTAPLPPEYKELEAAVELHIQTTMDTVQRVKYKTIEDMSASIMRASSWEEVKGKEK